MPQPGPNACFVLIVAGILLVYCEFIWVGKVFFGVAGAVTALIGIASLAQMPHSPISVCFIAGAVICFALEARLESHYLAGLAGSLMWGLGFWKLGPVLPQLAFPLSAVFGLITVWLLSISRQARLNKRRL